MTTEERRALLIGLWGSLLRLRGAYHVLEHIEHAVENGVI